MQVPEDRVVSGGTERTRRVFRLVPEDRVVSGGTERTRRVFRRAAFVLVTAVLGALSSPARGGIPVDGPGVTGIVDPNATVLPSTTLPGGVIPTLIIPTNVPPETAAPPLPTSVVTLPASTIGVSTTGASRRTTTTRRRTTTTRRGSRQSTTLLPSTTIVLDPLPDGATTLAPPVEAGPSTAAPPTDPAVPSTDVAASAPTTVGRTTTTAQKTTTTAPAANAAELKARVQTEIAKAGGSPGVMVVVDGQPMIDIGANQPKLPASTQKLYVAAAALSWFGADYRFETKVRAEPIANGVTASLTLVGAGDPSLTTADFRSMAKSVAATGITSISTRLNVDDSHFDRVTVAPGWKASFSPGESGLLNALMVDGNQRNDEAFRADPALANLAKFQQELQRAGITLSGAILGRSSAPSSATVVATHRSAPLSALLALMGKKSNNTYAEMILKELGAAGGGGSTAGGANVALAYLQKAGVLAPVRFADGSGLSSLNQTTAASEVSLLAKVDASKERATFRSTLAVACVDGTMKSRLCGTPGQGTVIAKTGTINGVAALSGYAVTASGRKVVFSFLMNGLKSSSTGRVAIDRALLQIIGYIG